MSGGYMKALSVTSLVFVVALGVGVSTRAQEPATGAKPAAQTAPAGNADTGKKLWVSVGCWQCHGYEGQGGAAGAGGRGVRTGRAAGPAGAAAEVRSSPTGVLLR